MAKNEKIQNLIVSLSERYTLDAIASVQRNLHINNLQGNEKITPDDVKKVLDAIIKKTKNSDCSSVFSRGELLEYMSTIITEIRDSFSDMDQKIADAILVDFTNFVGASQGINYGIHTKHLTKTPDN